MPFGEDFENMSEEPDMALCRTMMGGAVGFLEAAKAIYERPGTLHWPALYVNLCYSLELSLKAFLASRGWSERKLKKDLGHDLSKSFLKTQEHGYVSPHPAVQDIIALVSPLHKANNLRYLSGESSVLPENHASAIAITERHLAAVWTQIPG